MVESRRLRSHPPRRYRRPRWSPGAVAALARTLGALLAAMLVTVTFASPTDATTSGAGTPAQAEPLPRPLRVATYNIRHGVGLDGLLDLERVAQEIEDTGAEVVGLQEVDRHWGERSAFVDQAAWLAGRLGMDVVYGANLDRDPLTPDAPRRQYGTAILSSHRIRSSTNTLLPRPEGGEQRGLLEAVIKVRGLPVRVFNTHLQHNSQAERLAQVAQIRTVVAAAPESVVLVGDLNATPDSAEVSAITDDLVDAWVTAGVGDGYTYDVATPHARIDYVLTSDDLVARTAAVLTTEASDHLPVVVDLALPGGRPTGRG